MLVARRFARLRPVPAPVVDGGPAAAPGPHDIVLVLVERHRAHVVAAGGEVGASSDLALLRTLADSCGARSAECRRRDPTNIARNYYDGGRDFDVRITLTLEFSPGAASRFLDDAEPALERWLRCRSVHTATVRVGGAEVAVRPDEPDLAGPLLAHAAGGEPPPRDGAPPRG